jgi:UDP-glucose 4-epimerase
VGVKANMLSIIKLVDKFPVLPLANVKNKRSFTAIENLVALIDLTIEKQASGLFIAMDDKALSTTELTLHIAKALHKNIHLFSLPGFIIRTGKSILPRIFDRLYGSFEIDNSYTRKSLGYSPVISSEEGIKHMVEAHLLAKRLK